MGPISEFANQRMMVNQTFSSNISFLECSAEYDILFLQVRIRTEISGVNLGFWDPSLIFYTGELHSGFFPEDNVLVFWCGHHHYCMCWCCWQPPQHPCSQPEVYDLSVQPPPAIPLLVRSCLPPLQPGHEPHSAALLPLPRPYVPC